LHSASQDIIVAEGESAASRIDIARRAGRQIRGEGVVWLVYELSASPFDRRSKVALVFENDGAVRLVRSFPAEWRDLGEEALFALSFGI
jgi:hypothetical protein